MAPMPSGTVTFLFTDIEGSTRLWDRHPDAMSAAQAVHDRILRDAVREGDGYVFSEAGDGLGVSFSTPAAALQAAVAVQERLGVEAWPHPIEAVRVRMGLHSGPAVERDGNYFGTAVNRAARVSALGHGGQVLATEAVRLLAVDDLSDDWEFIDLGAHRLRDLTRPERLYQVAHPALERSFAPVRDAQRTGNLVSRRTSFVGRDHEVAEVDGMLERRRLVTLTGVGGVGKTRLATAVGERRATRYADGVWFVDLAALGPGADVAAAAATDLEVVQGPDATALERVVDSLERSRALVIVDNAEHVIDATAELVDAILERAGGIDILVTSREPLRVDGEVVFPVQPLPARGPHAASVELFLDRAESIAPGAHFHEEDLAAVGELCRRLDGLPLAIELAAAQVETHTAREILDGLGSTLSLEASARSTADRHRTLRATIEWSYAALDPRDQVVFDRLGVFLGGATADAVAGTCTTADGEKADVLLSLQRLVRKSMLTIERHRGGSRFGQLGTLRDLAVDHLVERGEFEEMSRRHAVWYANRARVIADGIHDEREADAVAEMFAEWDNMRAALDWALRTDAHDVVAALGPALESVVTTTMNPELIQWAHDALEVLPPAHPARRPYETLRSFGLLMQGDWSGAVDALNEDTGGVEPHDRYAIQRRELEITVKWFQGDLDAVIQHSPTIVADAIAAGLPGSAGRVGADLALALDYRGRRDDAVAMSERIMESATASGQTTAMVWAKYARGELLAEDQPVLAMEELEEAIELALSVRSDFIAGVTLITLAATAGRYGDRARALDSMERAIGFWERAGNRPLFWTTVRNLVELLDRIGLPDEAVVLNAACDADAAHAPELFGPYGERYRHLVDRIETATGSDATRRLRAEGLKLDYADAVARASRVIDEAKRATA